MYRGYLAARLLSIAILIPDLIYSAWKPARGYSFRRLSLFDISVAPIAFQRLSISTRDAQHPAWFSAWIDRISAAKVEARSKPPPSAPRATAWTTRERGRRERGRREQLLRAYTLERTKKAAYYFRLPFHGSVPAPVRSIPSYVGR